MQYVWQYRLWPTADMRTVDGRRVEVLDTGLLNRDAGPDFFNAKLLIGGDTWVGNVEIHVRASDWKRHGHDSDHAYDSVVLHVVGKDDMEVRRPDGQVIPQMVMACNPEFSQRYRNMVLDEAREMACAEKVASLDPVYVRDCMTAMAFERLFEKTDRVEQLVDSLGGNWTEAIYVTIARALGFGTNSQPFQTLALTTPLRHMLRHSDSLMSIEAFLFGQAGLLANSDPQNEYQQQLCTEYNFLAAKYGLQPSKNIWWKMARMRPQNFPHRRIAALATMVSDRFSIAGRLLNVTSEAEARALFDISLTGFWARHYNFSPTSVPTVKAIGYASATVLIINAVVPVLYAYGNVTGDERKQELAIDLLQSLKPESNSIVEIFKRAGLEAPDAFTTQAMIQLRRQYCESRKCLYCRLGHRMLSAMVK